MSFTAPTLLAETVAEANKRLGRIEAEEGVSVLFAVESGSRAWGFPSPDSDYDVRFFYLRPLSNYLGLDAPKDSIERPIQDLWDVNGWDIGKALRLLVKGNATVAEWLSSPLIYTEYGPVARKLRDLVSRHASPQQSARHYYGLGRTCYLSEIASRPTVAMIEEAAASGALIKGLTEVNQKKYLYALRAALCIAWIDRYLTVPPMTMPHLMAYDILPDPVRDELELLLKRKANMGEFMSGPRIETLDTYIETQLAWVKERGFDKLEPSDSFKSEANELLLSAYGL